MSGVIVVAGITGHLGQAIGLSLLDHGYSVIGLSRHPPEASCPLRDHSRFHWLAADLTAENASQRVVDDVLQLSGEVTGFVHAARGHDFLASGSASSESDWVGEYRISAVVPYFIARGLAERSSFRSVVIVSSIYGLVAQRPSLYADPGSALCPQYGAARAAIHQMVRDLAVGLAPGVTVNSVSFGGVEKDQDPEFVDRYGAQVPLGRMLAIADVPGPIRFLLSDGARGITGQNLVVDGGWTSW